MPEKTVDINCPECGSTEGTEITQATKNKTKQRKICNSCEAVVDTQSYHW